MDGIKELIEAQGRAFEEFKHANDQRLAEVEKKGHASADTVAAVEKLNAAMLDMDKSIREAKKRIDEQEIKSQRPGAGAVDEVAAEKAEYKKAFSGYIRKGEESAVLQEHKAMNMGTDPDGGFLVEEEMDAQIDRFAATVGAMRNLANVVTVGSREYKKLVKTSGISGGWLGEQEEGSESTAPKYSEVSIEVMKAYAEPWVTNDMLEDAGINVEADLAMEAGIGIGEAEAVAFISGTGVKKPRGILGYSIVANASYAWGKVGYIASGASGAFAASNPSDKLILLQHALKSQYRNGAQFLMSDDTLASVRQIKDGSGNFYLWQPDPSAEFSGRLLGYPVAIDDNMSAIASNSYSIAFGNFKRAYTIVDRRGVSVIRDNLTKKGITKFHFTRRTGGGITNFEAIKLMKFASS